MEYCPETILDQKTSRYHKIETNSVLKLRASDVIEKAKYEYEQKLAPITELMDSLFQKDEDLESVKELVPISTWYRSICYKTESSWSCQIRSFLFPQFKESPLTPLIKGGIKGGMIKLPKIGSVLIELHRPIPEGFVIKQVRVLSRARGTKWYVVITVQSNVEVPNPLPKGRGLAIDIGLENFLTTSDNFTIKPARFFRELQSRLKELQRKASRKKRVRLTFG